VLAQLLCFGCGDKIILQPCAATYAYARVLCEIAIFNQIYVNKTIKISLIICVVSFIIFVGNLISASLWTPMLGWSIEKFFPCQQSDFPLMDTPPCSVRYDFMIMPFILGIFIVSLLTLLGGIIYRKLKK
jgi:hypothetical protein